MRASIERRIKMNEISLYLLAKQAKADGKPKLVWVYAKDHARRLRAYFAKEKDHMVSVFFNFI
jgi:hypothetical protein